MSIRDSFHVDLKGFTGEMGRRGVAKSYLFSCVIDLPGIIKNEFLNEINAIQLRVEDIQIPPRQAMTVTSRYYGPPRYIPYGVMYQPITLTVSLSDTMLEREVFMRWQDLAVSGGFSASMRSSMGSGSIPAGYDTTYYKDLIGHIDIYQFPDSPAFQGGSGNRGLLQTIIGTAQAIGFDPTLITSPLGFDIGLGERRRKISPSYHFKLEECFPTFIQPIDMNWGAGEAAKMRVEITYHRVTEQQSEKSGSAGAGFELAKMVRQGMNIFNRFSPAFSLIKGGGLGGGLGGGIRLGLGGGLRALAGSSGSNLSNPLGTLGASIGGGFGGSGSSRNSFRIF